MAKSATLARRRAAANDEDAATPDTGFVAIREEANPEGRVQDFAEVIENVDPQGLHTEMDQVAGKTIIISAWGLNQGKLARSDGSFGPYAVLRYVFADDKKQQERWSTCGGVMIVDAVRKAIGAGVLREGPVRARILTYPTTKGNPGYKFARPGDK